MPFLDSTHLIKYGFFLYGSITFSKLEILEEKFTALSVSDGNHCFTPPLQIKRVRNEI